MQITGLINTHYYKLRGFYDNNVRRKNAGPFVCEAYRKRVSVGKMLNQTISGAFICSHSDIMRVLLPVGSFAV